MKCGGGRGRGAEIPLSLTWESLSTDIQHHDNGCIPPTTGAWVTLTAQIQLSVLGRQPMRSCEPP